jgi:hypothetical protein
MALQSNLKYILSFSIVIEIMVNDLPGAQKSHPNCAMAVPQ